MKTTSEKKSIKNSGFKKSDIFILISIGTFVFLVWFLLPYYMNWVFKNDDTFDMKGKFGDMYNVVTSLFSATTIILLVYTILQQRKDLVFAAQALDKQQEELELNREELGLNRDELKLTRKEFKTQNKVLKYQRFENTFFHLIELNLKVSDGYLNIYEKAVGKSIYQTNDFIEFESTTIGSVLEEESYNAMSKKYNDQYLSHIYNLFIQYLNSFNSILDFISTKQKKESREKYFKIYVAQLTKEEKVFLYFHFAFTENKPFHWNELCPILFRGLLVIHFTRPKQVSMIESSVNFLPKVQ